MTTVENISVEFEVLGFDEPPVEVLVKCLEICTLHDLTAESFVEQWVAFSLCNPNNFGGTQQPTLESITSFGRKKQTSKDKLKQTSYKKDSKINLYNEPNPSQSNLSDPILSAYNGNSSETAVNQSCVSSNQEKYNEYSQSSYLGSLTANPALSLHSQTYVSRKDSGKVVVTFGSHHVCNKAKFKNIGSYDKVNIIQWGNENIWLRSNATFNYETMTVKATILNELIEFLGNYLLRKYKLKKTDDLKYRGSDLITIYGRICCDDEGRLSLNSINLELSRKFGSDVRDLNLMKIHQGTLFPGQIVALEANVIANTLIVENIHSDASCPLPINLPMLPAAIPIQVIVAVGPFTLNDNLTYQPMIDLVTYINEHKPHIVIIIGPIVDTAHEGISGGFLKETFHSHFENIIDRFLIPLVTNNPNTQIILLPSYKEAYHCNVYPTPPYILRGKHHNLHLMPDPCVLDINGLILGVTSVDILFHLAKEELFWGKSTPDKMARIAKHILSQQSFYPLYPPAEDIAVDYGLLAKHGVLDVTPHILILPSNFRHFIKNIDGCIVVNPERITKGFVGGTFARMEIYSNQSNSSLAENIICEVVKI